MELRERGREWRFTCRGGVFARVVACFVTGGLLMLLEVDEMDMCNCVD